MGKVFINNELLYLFICVHVFGDGCQGVPCLLQDDFVFGGEQHDERANKLRGVLRVIASKNKQKYNKKLQHTQPSFNF
jgi:hypothetical protein